MTSKVLFHYILTLTMLFMSSFTAFHGSEHIVIDTEEGTVASFIEIKSSLHSESEQRLPGESDFHRTNHNFGSVCEACLVLSNFSACGIVSNFISISPEKTKHRLFNLGYFKRQFFLTYHSRAPPYNA